MHATTRNKELKALLEDTDIAKKIRDGYTVKGIFVTNARRDDNAINFLATSRNIVLYDAGELEASYVPLDKTAPIATEIAFDLFESNYLRHRINADVEMVVAPIAANDLVRMDGRRCPEGC